MADMFENQGKNSSGHRARLYERYVTLQLQADLPKLRSRLAAPQPYFEKIIKQHFPHDPAVQIIDLGCGYGLMLNVLRKLGFHNLCGIETSEEQVAAAHALGLDCVIRGDIGTELDGKIGVYDVVVAFDVLEHFTKDEALDLLLAIHRALKPGGKLILHVPNGEAIFAGKVFFGDFTHQTAFTAGSIAQVARYAGFGEVYCFEDRPVVHGPISAARAVLWWLVRTKFRLVNMIETGDTGGSLILTQNLLAVCRKPR